MNKMISPGEYSPALIRKDAVYQAAACGAENTEWRTGYLESVKALAKKDFSEGVRMGEAYKAMEKTVMDKYVSPDRAALIARTEEMMDETPEQDLSLELPDGHRADISAGPFPGAEIYNHNGECIASYTRISGWTEQQTIAEREFWRESVDTYIAAWNRAMTAARPQAVRRTHMDVTR